MSETEPKRLYRSRRDRMISGVCAGVAEYFNLDPAIVRIVWVLACLFGGAGVILYLAAMLIIPLNPQPTELKKKQRNSDAKALIGGLLIVLGAIIFAGHWGCALTPWVWGFAWGILGPIILILAGLALIFLHRKTDVSSAPEGVKRLSRRVQGRMFLGVASGTADYFNLDPTIARLAWIALFFITSGVGILIYFVLYFILPEKDHHLKTEETKNA